VSSLLKHGAKDNGARPWLSHMAWINSLTAATLYVMHPDLYKAGREVMVKFGQELDLTTDWDGLEELLPVWGSVFNAVSVISNRETPLHRDNYSRPQWYDLLATVGDYSEAEMLLPTIGLRLKYKRGTMVALSGKVLRHGVCKAKGDRLCLAWYMRDNLHSRMHVASTDWSRYQNVLES
jgi:hypothetical protein